MHFTTRLLLLLDFDGSFNINRKTFFILNWEFFVFSVLLLSLYCRIDFNHFNGRNGLSTNYLFEIVKTLGGSPSLTHDLYRWILQHKCIIFGQSRLCMGLWLDYRCRIENMFKKTDFTIQSKFLKTGWT